MLAQRDEHLLLGTVPLLAGPDDGVMQELGARLHELHGETELLVKVGHHEARLARIRLDGLHIGAGGAGLLQSVLQIRIAHGNHGQTQEVAGVLGLFQALHKHVDMVEARLVGLVELGEHRGHLEGIRLNHFDGMRAPGTVARMELEPLAIDLVAAVEQLTEGVGGVEERAGAEQTVVLSHKATPVRGTEAEHMNPIAALEVVGVVFNDDSSALYRGHSGNISKSV